MKIVVWILRFAIFLIVFWFALRNMKPVEVDIFGVLHWDEAPLILVMLASFALGTVFGLLLALPSSFRQRRELNRLRKEQARASQVGAASAEPVTRPVRDYPVQ